MSSPCLFGRSASTPRPSGVVVRRRCREGEEYKNSPGGNPKFKKIWHLKPNLLGQLAWRCSTHPRKTASTCPFCRKGTHMHTPLATPPLPCQQTPRLCFHTHPRTPRSSCSSRHDVPMAELIPARVRNKPLEESHSGQRKPSASLYRKAAMQTQHALPRQLAPTDRHATPSVPFMHAPRRPAAWDAGLTRSKVDAEPRRR